MTAVHTNSDTSQPHHAMLTEFRIAKMVHQLSVPKEASWKKFTSRYVNGY